MIKGRTLRFETDNEHDRIAYEILQALDARQGKKFIIEAIIHYRKFLDNQIVEDSFIENGNSLNENIKQFIKNEIQSAFAEVNKKKNIVSLKEDATDEIKLEQPRKLKEVPKQKTDVEEIKETIIEKPREEMKISAKALGFINQLGT